MTLPVSADPSAARQNAQAAGIAAQNTGVASAADSMMQSAGFKDADQDPGTGAAMAEGQPNNMPPSNGSDPASPHVGMREGIESEEIAL